MENKKFYVTIKGEKIEVTEEVYRAYVRPIRKEQRQKRRDWKCRVVGPKGNLIRCPNKCEECPYAKAGSPKESQSQMDRTGACDSSTVKRDDMDWWKQFGRAKCPESGTAAAPRGKNCRGNCSCS